MSFVLDEAIFICWLKLTASDAKAELIFWKHPFVDGKEFGAAVFG